MNDKETSTEPTDETTTGGNVARVVMGLRVRDAYASINGKAEEIVTMPSGGMDILADDGRTLYGLELSKDGALRIHSGNVTKGSNDVLIADRFTIKPVAGNVVELEKPDYGNL